MMIAILIFAGIIFVIIMVFAVQMWTSTTVDDSLNWVPKPPKPTKEETAAQRKKKLKKLVNEMGPEIYEVFETINNKNHV